MHCLNQRKEGGVYVVWYALNQRSSAFAETAIYSKVAFVAADVHNNVPILPASAITQSPSGEGDFAKTLQLPKSKLRLFSSGRLNCFNHLTANT